MSIAPRASAATAADVEAWLAELGLVPLERADREGVTSWDLVLDGRRRSALRVTLILDPALALIGWAHFAPPINDSFRKSYRLLLHWNDETPFVKFAVGEDERPLLIAELPANALDRDAVGLALARLLAAADRFHEPAATWLKGGGWSIDAPKAGGPGSALLDRYAGELGELLEAADPVEGSGAGAKGANDEADEADDADDADGADEPAGATA
jgi:hypothetical protein